MRKSKPASNSKRKVKQGVKNTTTSAKRKSSAKQKTVKKNRPGRAERARIKAKKNS